MAFGLYPTASESLATSQPLIQANFSYLQTIVNPTFLAEEHLIAGVGEIRMFGGTAAKVWKGWLVCDGAAYSRTNASYAGLFSIIETAYGTGDGSTTFNVPSFCNVFVRGVVDSPGSTGGVDSHTTTIGAGTFSATGTTGAHNGDGNNGYGTTAGGGPQFANHTHNFAAAITGAGSASTADNIPKYGTAIYIIKR